MGILNDIIAVVAKSAPLLGTVLGSPLAGVGISLLAGAFGVDTKNLSGLYESLTNSPDAGLKLKQLELQHEETLQQIASADYKIEVDDRKDARAREIALKDHVPTVLSIGFLCAYFIVQGYIVSHESSANDIISARFQDVLIMIISYYFGSSHKNQTES